MAGFLENAELVSVEACVAMSGAPYIRRKYVGRITYYDEVNDREFVASEYYEMDYGKSGISRAYVMVPENETAEHIAECRNRTERLAGEILYAQMMRRALAGDTSVLEDE